MTLLCASTKRNIPSPQMLISVAEVTLPESDEEWLEVARRRFDANTMFGDREIFLLTELRRALIAAPSIPSNVVRVARHKLYRGASST